MGSITRDDIFWDQFNAVQNEIRGRSAAATAMREYRARQKERPVRAKAKPAVIARCKQGNAKEWGL